MAKVKGTQFYLESTDPAEKALIDWADSFEGNKSRFVVNALILGHTLLREQGELADLLTGAARRGESINAERIAYYAALFATEKSAPAVPAPDLAERQPEPKPVAAVLGGFGSLGE